MHVLDKFSSATANHGNLSKILHIISINITTHIVPFLRSQVSNMAENESAGIVDRMQVCIKGIWQTGVRDVSQQAVDFRQKILRR